jgi:pimeloyl-ACP methyl ester carboxylesterase
VPRRARPGKRAALSLSRPSGYAQSKGEPFMGKVLKWLAIALAVITALVGLGAALLYRGDIPYAKLEQTYAGADSLYLDRFDGLRVRYKDAGPREARTIVLLHGFSASLETWDGWAADLAKDYRVIRLDLPGHGLTRNPPKLAVNTAYYADLVNEIVTGLGAKSYIVAGSSMGGHTAWQIAQKHPQNVEGLVLVGAAGWVDPDYDPNKAPLAFRLLRTPVLGPLMMNLENTAIVRAGLINSFHDPKFVTDAMVARYVQMARAPGHRDILRDIATGAHGVTFATPELMAQIAAPTLVLHGENDNLVPVYGGRKFVETIPGATGHFYKDVGHIPQEEITAQSLADLRVWLAARGLTPQPVAAAGAPLAPAAKPAAVKPLEGVY